MTRIAVVYYSTYGHIAQLARKVLEGANSVEGVTAELFRFPETLSDEILAKMHAAPKEVDVPEFTTDDLTKFDGFIFGYPTRFGAMPAQVKSFFDATGGLWVKGALVGKGVSVFTSVGTQGGGIETTVLTSLPNFVHHGMVFIPVGYSFPPQTNMDYVHAGTPYGASTYANADGSRQPIEQELAHAEHQGKHVAAIIKKLAA